jgi:hypothetical protein
MAAFAQVDAALRRRIGGDGLPGFLVPRQVCVALMTRRCGAALR